MTYDVHSHCIPLTLRDDLGDREGSSRGFPRCECTRCKGGGFQRELILSGDAQRLFGDAALAADPLQ